MAQGSHCQMSPPKTTSESPNLCGDGKYLALICHRCYLLTALTFLTVCMLFACFHFHVLTEKGWGYNLLLSSINPPKNVTNNNMLGRLLILSDFSGCSTQPPKPLQFSQDINLPKTGHKHQVLLLKKGFSDVVKQQGMLVP